MPRRFSGVARSKHGFTIVELMWVLALIAILASIAVPILTRSRISGNETSAVGRLRALSVVNEGYRVRFGSYAGSLDDLAATNFLDLPTAKSGYGFTYWGSKYDFTCRTSPLNPGVTGDRHFFVNSTGVIRFSTEGAATDTSSALDN